jgi:long-chain acyl-CoA synthetase
MTDNTLPMLLKKNAEKYGDRRIAMRVKDRGIWLRFTWKDYYENVKYFSLGLISLGMKFPTQMKPAHTDYEVGIISS